MTTRTHLPYDCARCNGHRVDGQLVKPCNTCAREQFNGQVNEYRQAWLIGMRPVMGYCPEHIDMEMEEAK